MSRTHPIGCHVQRTSNDAHGLGSELLGIFGCRSFAYPQMPALEDLQLNSDGRLAVAMSSDGVLSVMSADLLARGRGDTKLYAVDSDRLMPDHR